MERRRPSTALSVTGALLCLVLLGAGCSSSEPAGAPTDAAEPAATDAADGDDSGGDGTSVVSGPVDDQGAGAVENGAIALTAGNFSFSPTFVDAEPGEVVMVTVRNGTDIPHTFTIDALDVDVLLDGGAAESVEMVVDTATEFYCRFHAPSGMRGAFIPS